MTRLAVCVVLSAAVLLLGPPPDTLRTALALFVLIAGLWITQALPLPVTALLVPLLAGATGLMDVRAALASFAHPIIFLFLGGFALASALQQHGLDRALAQAVLRAAAHHRGRAVFLLAALSALLSMWISNTATAAMMLPLMLGLLADPQAGGGDASPASARTRTFALLAIAYSASIGGIATLVGSPPNAIAAAQAGIGFTQWLAYGLPAALLIWPVAMGVLWLALRPGLRGTMHIESSSITWTRPRITTLTVFIATVACWVAGAPIARALGVSGDVDSMVALAAVIVLIASGCLRWRTLESQTNWGVLLLFGGGLALSEVMQSSGASAFLAAQVLTLVRESSPLLVMALVIAFVVFLTELVSNTASAALVLPILLPAVTAMGMAPQAAAAAVAIAASCAFMLPVATPPNAIVYATDQVPQATMMRCGLWLNLACIAVLTALTAVAS